MLSMPHNHRSLPDQKETTGTRLYTPNYIDRLSFSPVRRTTTKVTTDSKLQEFKTNYSRTNRLRTVNSTIPLETNRLYIAILSEFEIDKTRNY